MDKERNQDVLTVHHAKPTDAMASVTTRRSESDMMTGEVKVEQLGVVIGLRAVDELKLRLGVRAHTLLLAGLAAFTVQNGFGRNKTINCPVDIPFDEYCGLIGYDISTKSRRDLAHRQIRQDLNTLQSVRFSWEEGHRWLDVNLMDSTCEVRRNRITMRFGQTFAEYIHKQPLLKIPKQLFCISGKNQNAYAIAHKIIVHSGNSGNQERGTANRLKVKTLLAVTNLPDYEQVLRTRQSWRQRIKRPFEVALDSVVNAGVIRSWKYNGIIDAEDDWHTFADTLIIFEI